MLIHTLFLHVTTESIFTILIAVLNKSTVQAAKKYKLGTITNRWERERERDKEVEKDMQKHHTSIIKTIKGFAGSINETQMCF